jgi:hypothetical protein
MQIQNLRILEIFWPSFAQGPLLLMAGLIEMQEEDLRWASAETADGEDFAPGKWKARYNRRGGNQLL